VVVAAAPSSPSFGTYGRLYLICVPTVSRQGNPQIFRSWTGAYPTVGS